MKKTTTIIKKNNIFFKWTKQVNNWDLNYQTQEFSCRHLFFFFINIIIFLWLLKVEWERIVIRAFFPILCYFFFFYFFTVGHIYTVVSVIKSSSTKKNPCTRWFPFILLNAVPHYFLSHILMLLLLMFLLLNSMKCIKDS